jgi:hypothetical protein
MAIAIASAPNEARSHLSTLASMTALFAVVGIELMVLVTWTPDTLRVWFDPETHGYGDFRVFFENARRLSLTNMYSPGLPLLMHPLTKLSMPVAFAVYTAINVAALTAIAFLAQRAVTSLPAKVVVALGVFTLPQTHWALRVGHFTEVLALASLCGLLLCGRRPVVAGIFIAVLALKPQYLAVPLLYLLLTKNFRAFAAATGGLAALGTLGVAAMALRDPSGLRMFAYTGEYYARAVPDLLRYITIGQGDANYTQSWQYSWYGFLVSIGVDRNPLVALALTSVSLAAMLVAWRRCSPSVAKAAFALGMLLVVPHTTFYNWSMLSVAFVLLLHSDLRPRSMMPLLIGGVAIAAAATQQATPWPLPLDRYRPAGTLGIYWIQPAALASICALALAGRRSGDEETPLGAAAAIVDRPVVSRAWLSPSRSFVAVPILAVVALVAGYMTSAYVSGSAPFRTDRYFSRSQVLSAVPADFPLPSDARLHSTGSGERLPYRVEWRSEARVSEVAGIMRARLDDGSWTIVAPADDGDPATIDLRSARGVSGEAPVIAELHVSPAGQGSVLRLEFSPLPASSVPGYERWLEHIGLVVHDVDPALVDGTP